MNQGRSLAKLSVAVVVFALLFCTGCDSDLAPPSLGTFASEFKNAISQISFGAKRPGTSGPSNSPSATNPNKPSQNDPEIYLMSQDEIDAIEQPSAITDKMVNVQVRESFGNLAKEDLQPLSSKKSCYGPLVSDEKFTYFISATGSVYRYENGTSPDDAIEFLTDDKLLYLLSADQIKNGYKSGGQSRDFFRLVTAMSNYRNENLMDAISYNFQLFDVGDSMAYDSSADPRWASPEGARKVLFADMYYSWCLLEPKSGKVQIIRFGSKTEYFGYIDANSYDEIIMQPGGRSPFVKLIRNGESRYYMLDYVSNRQNIENNIVPPPDNTNGSMKKHGDYFLFFETGNKPGLYVTTKPFMDTTMLSDLVNTTWSKVYDGEVKDAYATDNYVYAVIADENDAASVVRIDRQSRETVPMLTLQGIGGGIFMPEAGEALYTWDNDGIVSRHMIVGNVHYKNTIGVLDQAPPREMQVLFTGDYLFAYELAQPYDTRPKEFIGYLPLFES